MRTRISKIPFPTDFCSCFGALEQLPSLPEAGKNRNYFLKSFPPTSEFLQDFLQDDGFEGEVADVDFHVGADGDGLVALHVVAPVRGK